MKQLVRLRPVQKKNRKISIGKEKKIVHDYFNHSLTPTELSNKYNVNISSVGSCIQNWQIVPTNKRKATVLTSDFAEYPKSLLIVNTKDLEFITFLLAEYGMDNRSPEHYKYVETFESKINDKRKRS